MQDQGRTVRRLTLKGKGNGDKDKEGVEADAPYSVAWIVFLRKLNGASFTESSIPGDFNPPGGYPRLEKRVGDGKEHRPDEEPDHAECDEPADDAGEDQYQG